MRVYGHAPMRKFRKIKQFGAFCCMFRSDFVLKYFQTLQFCYKKYNDCNCTLPMGYYASRENFENMLQVMHFDKSWYMK